MQQSGLRADAYIQHNNLRPSVCPNVFVQQIGVVMPSIHVQVEADYGRPKDGLGRVMSTADLQTLAVEQTSPAREPYAGVGSPNAAMGGNPPGPLALLVKVKEHDFQQSAWLA